MVRKTRTHLSDKTSDVVPRLLPRHLTRQEFAKRLYQLMLGKSWRQSDLARASKLPRDSISAYIRGNRLPTPQSLSQLAKTFNVKPEDLLPNYAESAIDADSPAFEMKVSPSAPNKAWLRVNQLVSTSTAVKIAELLQADNE